METMVEIKTNRVRATIFTIALFIGGILGIYEFIFADTDKIWMLILAFFLLLTFVFMIFSYSFYIKIYQDELIIKLFKTRKIKPDEISQIDWTFFSQRKGNCYINLINGKTMVFSKAVYEKKFKTELMKFAERNGITQRGLD